MDLHPNTSRDVKRTPIKEDIVVRNRTDGQEYQSDVEYEPDCDADPLSVEAPTTFIMVASCIEERDGKVKSAFCSNLPKEEPRARTCNEHPCQTRWKVWKWGPCSGCLFQSGVRTRRVECVKENPTNKGDEEIITEPSECCGEPPKKSELCNSPRPCPKNMTSAIVKRKIDPVEVLTKDLEKREEGKSFSDITTTTPGVVKDIVKPHSIHIKEVLLDDSGLNLTDSEFEDIGDEVEDKVLSCPIQSLSGREAMERLNEIVHGSGYQKNTTKIKTGGKGVTHSTNSSTNSASTKSGKPTTTDQPHNDTKHNKEQINVCAKLK